MQQRLFDNKVITKEKFRFNNVIEGLDLSKKITEQKEVILIYQDNDGIKKIPVKHGIVTIFQINHVHYVLGLPMTNPETNTMELQASIGGKEKAFVSISMKNSLNKEIKDNTNNKLDLSIFEISSSYVCHRVPDWGEWSVCFIKVVAISKNFTMDQLKSVVSSMNKGYGIYELDEVIAAAKITAGMQESPNKPKSVIKNHYTGLKESWVIFDDNAISKLFETLTPIKLFNNHNISCKL
jgi:hypothetical protein